MAPEMRTGTEGAVEVGWWSKGRDDGAGERMDGAREEAMDVGRGRGERMGKWNWMSDGVRKRVLEVGKEQ